MEEHATNSMEVKELYIKYRESTKGKVMRDLLKRLDQFAIVLLKHHDINCCSKQDTKHLKFHCGFSKEVIIMGYHCYNYAYLGAEQVEQFVIFMGASEIESFMTKYYETCIACNDLKSYVSAILDHCLEHFSNNHYIIDYKKRLIDA